MRAGAAGGKAGISSSASGIIQVFLFITFKELQWKEVSVKWMRNSGRGAQRPHLGYGRGVALKDLGFG